MGKLLRFAGIMMVVMTILGGCRGIDAIEVTSVDHFEFRGIADNIIIFSADIGVSNPSVVNFKVNEINLRTIADGNYLGSLTNYESIKIPAHSDSIYSMLFNLRLSNILSGASTLYTISRQRKVNIELQGYVKSRSGIFTKKLDVQESQIVDVPRLNFFN